MTTSTDQGLSSILREGDYFVISAGKDGLSVEFSADGSPDGPVAGGFAALRGHVALWKAGEVANILAERGEDAESFLIRELRRQIGGGKGARVGPKGEPKEQLAPKLARLLRSFAEEYPTEPGSEVYTGWLSDFHRDVINIIHPGPLDTATKRAIVRLEELLPGIHVSQQGKGPQWTWLEVDWAAVAGEKEV
jgi:hypothetical protein